MASQELEKCVDIAGDEDSLNVKLAIIKVRAIISYFLFPFLIL